MTANSAPAMERPSEEHARRIADVVGSAIQRTEGLPPVAPTMIDALARVIAVGGQPLQAAFLARALNAVTSLALELDNRELGDATGAPSDYGVLLRALEGPEAVRLLQGRDPLAAARLRGLEARARLLRVEGEPLTVDEVAKALHVTRQAVDKRRRAGKLIGLDTGRRGYLYPRWQIGPDGMLPGLEETLTHLGVRDPWMQAAFFVSGSTYLDGETPVAALRSGRLRDVVRAAAAYGEQGAA